MLSDDPPRNLNTLQVLRDSYGGSSLNMADRYTESHWQQGIKAQYTNTKNPIANAPGTPRNIRNGETISLNVPKTGQKRDVGK